MNLTTFNGGFWNNESTMHEVDLTESQASADTRVETTTKQMNEFVFLSDVATFTKNKALNDTVTLGDWLSINLKNPNWTGV